MDSRTVIERVAKRLHAEGGRMTVARSAVVTALAENEGPLTAEQVGELVAADAPSVHLATVYRTLSELEAQGLILKVVFEGEPARYEPADQRHHDHMIDIESGAVMEFYDDRIERLQAEIAAEMGYEIVRHRLELYVRKKP